jgi:ribokinase
MHAAVVGHVEWVEFLRVDHLPSAGEIVHATEWWTGPGGGGAVAAVQLMKLAGDAVFFTAFGDDELGHRAYEELMRMGLRVEATFRPEPMRRGMSHIDAEGERTITVVGPRLAPYAEDPLPWEELREIDAVYFTAGDRLALQAARRARVLVATSRILPFLKTAGVELDVLIGSATDPSEAFRDAELEPQPRLEVRTRGGEGGTFRTRGSQSAQWAPQPVPGPVVDRYGAGDSFAGALAWALAAGHESEAALALAARCGAAVLTARGPYEGQLSAGTFSNAK